MFVRASAENPRETVLARSQRSAWSYLRPSDVATLGRMRAEIAETKGDVFWTDLTAHVARDAVIIVDVQLDLVDVGVALATNDTTAVDAWIQSGKLQKPSKDDLSRWSIMTNLTFASVVVQPFVLIHRPMYPPPS